MLLNTTYITTKDATYGTTYSSSDTTKNATNTPNGATYDTSTDTT